MALSTKPIQPVPVKPGRIGLLSVATEIGLTGGTVEFGVTFAPDVTTPPDPVPGLCSNDVISSAGVGPTATSWYTIYATGEDAQRSTWDQTRDRRAVAKRHLELTESHQVEAEFAFLAATGGEVEENPGLWSAQAADYATLTPRPTLAVIADLDSRLSVALGGGTGMLHMDPATATIGIAIGALYRDGKFVRSAGSGHIVAIGTGYAAGTRLYDSAGAASSATVGPFTPGSGSSFVYATPHVFFQRGDIEFFGDDMAAVDRRTNSQTVRAQREVLIAVDNTFKGVAAVDLTKPPADLA